MYHAGRELAMERCGGRRPGTDLAAASPLLTCALAAAAVLFAFAGRDLPPPERRRLMTILGIALRRGSRSSA